MMAAVMARTAVLPLLAVTVVLGSLLWPPVGPPQRAVADQTDRQPAWRPALESMDRALVAGDVSAAEMAWRDAYGHAIRSRRWEGLLAVGEGALRIGKQVAANHPYQSRAREAWLSALFNARGRRSLEGVLAVTEAFGTLNDTTVVAQALSVADELAAHNGNGDARREVLAVRARLLPSIAQRDAR